MSPKILGPLRPAAWFVPTLFVAAISTASVSAADKSSSTAADLLPSSVIAYAEVPLLGEVIETVAEHPLRERIESMPPVRAIGDSEDFRPLRDGLAAFEGGMGRPWDEAIELLTDGGVHVAFDAPTQGAALLIKSSSDDMLKRFRSVVLAIGQLGRGQFGLADQADYRGFTAYAIGDKLKMAIVDNWFLMTNKPELGKSIIDRYLDGGKDSLAAAESFQSAMAVAGDATVKAYLDLTAVRAAGVAPKLYDGKTENVAAEAIFGGIVANLQQAPAALAVLNVDTTGIGLAVSTPHQAEWTAGREYYFGKDSQASAPPLLDVPERILALSTHRDLSQMWLRAPDLMSDKANEDLAKADTNLTTFFSGRDFGEDILGSLHPGIQVVVHRQTLAEDAPQPAIKLPAFAMQFRMRNPEETTREFRRVFQNVVGFINVVGAMQGQPQLDLDYQHSDTATLVTSTYVPPRDEQERISAPINYNFSPTIAFADDRMILSSTTALARTLTHTGYEVDSGSKQPNSKVVLNAKALHGVLDDNKGQLIAQNMLEKGHGPDQAKAEIGALLEIINLFQDLSVDLDIVDGRLKLTTELRVIDTN